MKIHAGEPSPGSMLYPSQAISNCVSNAVNLSNTWYMLLYISAHYEHTVYISPNFVGIAVYLLTLRMH